VKGKALRSLGNPNKLEGAKSNPKGEINKNNSNLKYRLYHPQKTLEGFVILENEDV